MSCDAGAAIVTRAVAESAGLTPGLGRALLLVDDADRALVALLGAIAVPRYHHEGVHAGAVVEAVDGLGAGVSIGAGSFVGPGSTIGDGTVLHANVTIGADVSIGAGCELMAGVVVYDRCRLGSGVVVHANTVIGADGFGYVPRADGRGVEKVPHIGDVVIGDGVEIGAGSCIDRGKLGSTAIGDGTKIDNLVQIGHNCEVGRSCIICGCTGLAGSVQLGDGVTVAASVGIADNVRIGAGATIGAGSGVMDNIPAGATWVGIPARPARETMKILAATRMLPAALKRLRGLERQQGSPGEQAK